MIAIIDYGAGNTKSVINALDRLGAEYLLTATPSEIVSADRVILPGVGHAQYAKSQLERSGLWTLIPMLRQPVLGICLGMQLLYDDLEEADSKGLGIISGTVAKFDSDIMTVPQMGWNTVRHTGAAIFEGIESGAYFYMVHSYYASVGRQTVATTDAEIEYTVSCQENNFFGVQFHPEKSGEVGQKLLQNFITN